MTVTIQRRKTLFILLVIIIFLGLAHTASLFSAYILNNEIGQLIAPKFNLDEEGNFPTFYSAVAILICSGLFAIIAREKQQNHKPYWQQWWGLSAIFLFLSLDEAAQIHELFDNDTLLSGLETTGFFAWPWVIPYMIIVVLFTIVFFRFFLSLPMRYKLLFGVSAGLYVFAAIGMEMIGAYVYELTNSKTPTYVLIFSLEEMIEMFSIALLIYSLLLFIEQEVKTVSIHID